MARIHEPHSYCITISVCSIWFPLQRSTIFHKIREKYGEQRKNQLKFNVCVFIGWAIYECIDDMGHFGSRIFMYGHGMMKFCVKMMLWMITTSNNVFLLRKSTIFEKSTIPMAHYLKRYLAHISFSSILFSKQHTYALDVYISNIHTYIIVLYIQTSDTQPAHVKGHTASKCGEKSQTSKISIIPILMQSRKQQPYKLQMPGHIPSYYYSFN